MSAYRHHVVGFFPHRTQAEKTFSRLIAQGISPRYIRVFDKYAVLPISLPKPEPLSEDNQTWASANLDSLIGTGLSGLLGIKLVAANVSLIVEPSLIDSLVTLGWGINIGVVQTNFYNREEVRLLSDLVHDAILSRQIVIIVETNSPEETALVTDAIHIMADALTNVI